MDVMVRMREAMEAKTITPELWDEFKQKLIVSETIVDGIDPQKIFTSRDTIGYLKGVAVFIGVASIRELDKDFWVGAAALAIAAVIYLVAWKWQGRLNRRRIGLLAESLPEWKETP